MRKDYALTSIQRADARKAIAILEGTGITLEAAAEIAARGRRARLRLTFETACDEFVLLKSKEGLRTRSVETYEQKLGQLKRDLGERVMDEIKRADLDKAVRAIGKTKGTRASLVRCARALWNWAMVHDPQIVVEDVTQGMDSLSARNAGDAKFLTVDETKKIMEAAACERGGRYLPALALMLFAGIRPEEIAGRGKTPLRWEHINCAEKFIRVPADVAKTGKPRIIEGLPDKVWEYLKPGENKDPVSPYRTRQAIRLATEAIGREWPHDATRHTFATYALAFTADPGKVSLWLGHEGKPTLLHQTYRGLATKAQAEGYWA